VSQLSPIKSHWRGQYALIPTLLVTVLALRYLLGLLQGSVPVSGMYGWMAFSLGVFVWQIVGASRAADRFLKYSGNIAGLYIAYVTLLALVAMTVSQLQGAFSPQQITASVSESSASDPMVMVQRGSLRRVQDTIVVEGNFDWELYRKFKSSIHKNPDIKQIRLQSTGGYVFVARAMSEIILNRSLDTHVSRYCYSACTVAFLAGERRTMSEGAQLGFHRYKLEAPEIPGLVDVGEELERDKQFFALRGVSAGFVEQVFLADHADLWKPDQVLLSESGVLVH